VAVTGREKEISPESSNSSCQTDRTRREQREMHKGGVNPTKERGMYGEGEPPPGDRGCEQGGCGHLSKVKLNGDREPPASSLSTQGRGAPLPVPVEPEDGLCWSL